MKLDVQVQGRKVASLFRERDDYVLQYEQDAASSDFVSLTMPVRQEAWRWPRDEPQWRGVAIQMLHAWNEGMESLRTPKKSSQFTSLKPVIEAASFRHQSHRNGRAKSSDSRRCLASAGVGKVDIQYKNAQGKCLGRFVLPATTAVASRA
jgi:HipA N-terminal domain